MKTPRPLGAVHLIADLDWARASGFSPQALRARVRELLAAGLPSLQLRGKASPAAHRLALGEALAAEAAETGAVLVVNGDPELAVALGARHVHLPAGADPGPLRARRPPLLFGQSCHDEEELARAEGADWVFVSPVFATRSKPGASPLGEDGLARLVARSPSPVYALGGVHAGNAARCLRAGAAGVAAIRGLLGPGGEALAALARTLPSPGEGDSGVSDPASR